MKLDDNDAQVIAAYVRANGYNGPVIVCISKLEEIHMPICEVFAQMALAKAQVASKRKTQ